MFEVAEGREEKFSHLPSPDRGGTVNFSLVGSLLIFFSLCPGVV